MAPTFSGSTSLDFSSSVAGCGGGLSASSSVQEPPGWTSVFKRHNFHHLCRLMWDYKPGELLKVEHPIRANAATVPAHLNIISFGILNLLYLLFLFS